MSIIIALIIFSVLVLFHEFGHFIVAKKNGIVVNEFSIGMGPRLFSFGKGETRYSIKLLPFGGSCAMLGEDEDVTVAGSFNSKSVWARMAVVFAGPFFNFILAWIMALIVIGYAGVDLSYVVNVDSNSKAYEAGLREGDRIVKYNGTQGLIAREIYLEDYVNPLDGSPLEIKYIRDGRKYTVSYTPDSTEVYRIGMTYTATDDKAVISSVSRNSAMQEAGVEPGDVITSINGVKVSSGKEMQVYLDEHPWDGSKTEITYERHGKEYTTTVTPKMTKVYSTGFDYNMAREKQSFLGVLKYSFVEVRYQIATVLKSLKMLVTGKVSTNEMSGPVGIVDAIGTTYNETKSEGIMLTIMTMINMAIMLSANLGVMNLLPLPALDGGRLVFFIVEAIRRKPVDREKEGFVHFIGFACLMVLMVFLIFNDIGKML